MTDKPPSSRTKSHGRGGACNLGPTTPIGTSDLITPNIKNPIYTTGRGGLGNLAKADPANPAQARESQDVAPATRRFSETGASFVGRGGAANYVKTAEEQTAAVKNEEGNARVGVQGKNGAGAGEGGKKGWWKGVVGGVGEERGGSSG